MAGLFGKSPKMPPPPKAVRAPLATDPDTERAVQRTKAAALARSGRLSTIMTDSLRETTGSSGQKLGA